MTDISDKKFYGPSRAFTAVVFFAVLIATVGIALNAQSQTPRYLRGDYKFDEIIDGLVSYTSIHDATGYFPDNRLEPILEHLYLMIPDLNSQPGLTNNYYYLGDGTNQNFTWSNSSVGRWPIITVRENIYPYRAVHPAITIPTAGTIRIHFDFAPLENQYVAYAIPADITDDATTVNHDLDSYNLIYAAYDETTGASQILSGYTASATEFTVPMLPVGSVVSIAKLNNEIVLSSGGTSEEISHGQGTRNIMPMLRQTRLLTNQILDYFPLAAYEFNTTSKYTSISDEDRSPYYYTVGWSANAAAVDSLNYFYHIGIGDATMEAEYPTDSMMILSGNAIDLVIDATNDTLTISSDALITTSTAYDVYSTTQTNYVGAPLNFNSITPDQWADAIIMTDEDNPGSPPGSLTESLLQIYDGHGYRMTAGGGYSGIGANTNTVDVWAKDLISMEIWGASIELDTRFGIESDAVLRHSFTIMGSEKLRVSDATTTVYNDMRVNGGVSYAGAPGITTATDFNLITDMKFEAGTAYIKSVSLGFTAGGLTVLGETTDWTEVPGQ